MTPLLQEQFVQGWLKDIAKRGEHDQADVHAMTDWIIEQEAPLADVLMLFAKGPPTWLHETWEQDEALRDVLFVWLDATEGEQWPHELNVMAMHDPLIKEIAALCEIKECGRAGLVNLFQHDHAPIIRHVTQIHGEAMLMQGLTEMPVNQTLEEAMATLRKHRPEQAADIDRDLKRRILSLFPEVERTFEQTVQFRLPMTIGERHRHETNEIAAMRTIVLDRWGYKEGPSMRRRIPLSHKYPIGTASSTLQSTHIQTRPAPDWMPKPAKIPSGWGHAPPAPGMPDVWGGPHQFGDMEIVNLHASEPPEIVPLPFTPTALQNEQELMEAIFQGFGLPPHLISPPSGEDE